MRALPILIGTGAVAAYFYSRSKRRGASAATLPLERLPGRWVWPVSAWKGRSPVISDGFGSPRPGGLHQGVDIMFRRRPEDAFKAGTPNGSQQFVMPDDVTALAAADGVVWSAMQTPRGLAVVIDHTPLPYATFYTHLDKLLVRTVAPHEGKQHVRAGEPIGIVGFDPLDEAHLKHLHFELWHGGPANALDPSPVMPGWEIVGGLRNGSLTYRPLGWRGELYPQWVRDLKDKSGVYIIRELGGEIVYVGSSIGCLYATLTRHFQQWRRWKGFWKGQYGEGHDPGVTYHRERVDVAVRITRASEAHDEELRLIHRLRPRDNLVGQPVDDDVPF